MVYGNVKIRHDRIVPGRRLENLIRVALLKVGLLQTLHVFDRGVLPSPLSPRSGTATEVLSKIAREHFRRLEPHLKRHIQDRTVRLRGKLRSGHLETPAADTFPERLPG